MMNRIIEEETEKGEGDQQAIKTVEQLPEHRQQRNSIYSSKQTPARKAPPTNRSTSLPSRQFFSSSVNIDDNGKQRRRYASDSNHYHPPPPDLTTSLVTSFLQYLRSELRATTNERKKKSLETVDCSSEILSFSINSSPAHYSINMSSSSPTLPQPLIPSLNSDQLCKNSFDDENEISTLINLLIRRVECLDNEQTKNRICPTIKQVDQNLIQYLYYLFNKFVNDDTERTAPMIGKAKFVNVCQTLVRHGCFNMPTSPDQSCSESTLTNGSERTLTQTSVREYRPEEDDLSLVQPSIDETTPATINDRETWLIVDLELVKPKHSATTPEESKCLLQSPTSDDPLFFSNENYFSFEEIKSCESESSQSNYYSADSSLIDLQNMVQEFDELNNHNNNNNNNSHEPLCSEDRSALTNQTNVINEANDTTTSANNICTGSTDHCPSSNGQVASTLSLEETIEQLPMHVNGKMSRRERKMQERWLISTRAESPNEQPSTKAFLGVEFPPIAALRRKFSTSPQPIPHPLPKKRRDSSSLKDKTSPARNDLSQDNIDKLNPSFSPSNTEIRTSIGVNETTDDQMRVVGTQLNDTSSLPTRCENKPHEQLANASGLSVDQMNANEQMTKQKAISTPRECEKEALSSVYNDRDADGQMNRNVLMMNSCTSNIPSCSSLLSISSSMIHTIENKANELLPREILDGEEEEEEKRKEQEQRCDDGDNNGDTAKRNNCNIEHNYHASGTILINDEPTTQTISLEQEEKERPSSPLSTPEHCCKQQIEDEFSAQVSPEDLDPIAMVMIDNDQRYKAIEIEDVPDEDDEEQQAFSIPTNSSIKPTDFIFTDDESRLLSEHNPVQPNTINIEELDIPLSKESQIPSATSTTKRSQRPEDDPIALRALQRFEQRMSAAAAAAASKTNTDEGHALVTKGKSSWSGTLPTPRKSLENLLKDNQQLQSTDLPSEELAAINASTASRDTFIRPRRTMLDDIGLNFGMTMNVFGTNSTKSHHHKSDEQQQQQSASNDKEVDLKEATKPIDTENCREQSMTTNSPLTHENGLHNEVESSHTVATPLLDQPSNTIISHSSSEQQQPLAPYRLELEGRRRLNTLERIRERHQHQNLMEQPLPPPLQFHHEHTIKPEQLQDPIIRRALERFDEKSRSLSQAKPTNYDDIQDPITRRALMRLETNLKRTNPTPATLTDPSEAWYTNSYTLGSLQNNRVLRYPDPASLPTSNLKPPLPPPSISIHQRFCSTSSETPEFAAGTLLTNNELDIEMMRVPTQPVYVTSHNHQQQTPINFRQRSRSEDMLSSRNLSLGQATDIDDRQTSNLQRTHSSDELHQQEVERGEETFVPNEISPNETEVQSPNTMDTSAENTTPTPAYSASSCEYTRPHENQSITSDKSDPPSARTMQQAKESEIQYPPPSSSLFTHVHSSPNNYYSQQPLPTPSYSSMYTSSNLNQTPYSDDPIVRRALERFNSQMQNSMMSMSQHQPPITPMPRQFVNHGNFDSFCPTDDAWSSSNRAISSTTSGTSTGYQSIIGRRRQMRHDDMYHDPTSVGNGYSTASFINSQNPYAIANPYMQFSDEPPAVAPRLHHDMYHEQHEYLSENVNNNNNNNNNNNGFLHHAYPATTNGFRPINPQYISSDSFQQFHDEDYLRHRAQSTSSTTSSDSVNPIRLIHQRLPPTAARTLIEQNKKLSPENSQSLTVGQTTANNGSVAGDSVFHRLAYTATKSSLSKSSSNLCANLLSKTPQQQPPPKPNPVKAQDSDLDTSITPDPNQESGSTLANKCQRSRSVDGRARLKNAQLRTTNNRSINDEDEQTSTTIPSSKFTPVTPRRDAIPPRLPTTPRSMMSDRVSSAKRVSNGNHIPYPRSGIRTRGSHGNLIDHENDENQAFNENYQPKIIDSKSRTPIVAHRYASNNHIQTSASSSSVNSPISRTRLPTGTSANLDRRDSNASSSDLHRSSKRSDDTRILSPTGQRRPIPVSVFAPAKHSAPISPSSTSPTITDQLTSDNSESPPEQEHEQTSCSSHSSTGDSSYTTINNENEMNQKLSSTNSALKTSTGNILNELSLANDRHEHSKKMNVFERLFRGHKKKI